MVGVKLQKERPRGPQFFKKVEIVVGQVIANTSKVLSDKISVCVEKTWHAQHKSSEMSVLPKYIIWFALCLLERGHWKWSHLRHQETVLNSKNKIKIRVGRTGMGWMFSEGSGWLRMKVSILFKPVVGDFCCWSTSSNLRLKHQQSLVAVSLYKLKTGSSLQILQKLSILGTL